jgi:hypothetical protein
VVATKSTTTPNGWTGTFTPSTLVPSNTSYTFTAVASDAARNQKTSAAVVKTVQ